MQSIPHNPNYSIFNINKGWYKQNTYSILPRNCQDMTCYFQFLTHFWCLNLAAYKFGILDSEGVVFVELKSKCKVFLFFLLVLFMPFLCLIGDHITHQRIGSKIYFIYLWKFQLPASGPICWQQYHGHMNLQVFCLC